MTNSVLKIAKHLINAKNSELNQDKQKYLEKAQNELNAFKYNSLFSYIFNAILLRLRPTKNQLIGKLQNIINAPNTSLSPLANLLIPLTKKTNNLKELGKLYRLIAEIYIIENKNSEAKKYLDLACEQNPFDVRLYNLYGKVDKQNIKQYQQLITLLEDNPRNQLMTDNKIAKITGLPLNIKDYFNKFSSHMITLSRDVLNNDYELSRYNNLNLFFIYTIATAISILQINLECVAKLCNKDSHIKETTRSILFTMLGMIAPFWVHRQNNGSIEELKKINERETIISQPYHDKIEITPSNTDGEVHIKITKYNGKEKSLELNPTEMLKKNNLSNNEKLLLSNCIEVLSNNNTANFIRYTKYSSCKEIPTQSAQLNYHRP